MNFTSMSHLHGEIVVEHGFPLECNDVVDVLRSTIIPLRPHQPFTTSGRPATPKRQKVRRNGRNDYLLMPVDQTQLNRDIDDAFQNLNWRAQPLAYDRNSGAPIALSNLRGDFEKNSVFVEVEFGNSASMFRDLFKFQVASRSGVGDAAVLILPTRGFARTFDQGIATFEQASELLPLLRIGIQMPVWLIGLRPSDAELHTIENKYREMYRIAMNNGVSCHAWDSTYYR